MHFRLPAIAVASMLLVCPLSAQQRQDEEYTEEDQGTPPGSPHHDRAGGSPPGLEQRADAAQVPRPDSRHAG